MFPATSTPTESDVVAAPTEARFSQQAGVAATEARDMLRRCRDDAEATALLRRIQVLGGLTTTASGVLSA